MLGSNDPDTRLDLDVLSHTDFPDFLASMASELYHLVLVCFAGLFLIRHRLILAICSELLINLDSGQVK